MPHILVTLSHEIITHNIIVTYGNNNNATHNLPLVYI